MKASIQAIVGGPNRKPVYKVTRKTDEPRWYWRHTLPQTTAVLTVTVVVVYARTLRNIPESHPAHRQRLLGRTQHHPAHELHHQRLARTGPPQPDQTRSTRCRPASDHDNRTRKHKHPPVTDPDTDSRTTARPSTIRRGRHEAGTVFQKAPAAARARRDRVRDPRRAARRLARQRCERAAVDLDRPATTSSTAPATRSVCSASTTRAPSTDASTASATTTGISTTPMPRRSRRGAPTPSGSRSTRTAGSGSTGSRTATREPTPPLTSAGYQQEIESYVADLNAHGIYAILDLHWTAPGSPGRARAAADARPGSLPGVLDVGGFDLQEQSSRRLRPLQRALRSDRPAGPATIRTRTTRSAGTAGRPAPRTGRPAEHPAPPRRTTRTTSRRPPTRWPGCRRCWTPSATRARSSPSSRAVWTSPTTSARATTAQAWMNHAPDDPLNQEAASFHNYMGKGCDSATCWKSTIAPIAAHVPVVTGEFDEDNFDETKCATKTPSTFDADYMNWADSAGVSYLAWGWIVESKDEQDADGCSAFFLINDYASYTPAQPNGVALHAHLRGLLSPATAPSTGTTTTTTSTPQTTTTGKPGSSVKPPVTLAILHAVDAPRGGKRRLHASVGAELRRHPHGVDGRRLRADQGHQTPNLTGHGALHPHCREAEDGRARTPENSTRAAHRQGLARGSNHDHSDEPAEPAHDHTARRHPAHGLAPRAAARTEHPTDRMRPTGLAP